MIKDDILNKIEHIATNSTDDMAKVAALGALLTYQVSLEKDLEAKEEKKKFDARMETFRQAMGSI